MYGFRYEELFHSSIWYSHSRTLDAMSNSSGGWDFSWSIENLTGDVIMNLVPTNRPQHSRSFEWHRAIPKFDPGVSVMSSTLQDLNLPWLLQLPVSVWSSRHRWEGVSELERTATRTESDKIFVPLAACLIFIRSITLQPIVRDWMHSSGERLWFSLSCDCYWKWILFVAFRRRSIEQNDIFYAKKYLERYLFIYLAAGFDVITQRSRCQCDRFFGWDGEDFEDVIASPLWTVQHAQASLHKAVCLGRSECDNVSCAASAKRSLQLLLLSWNIRQSLISRSCERRKTDVLTNVKDADIGKTALMVPTYFSCFAYTSYQHPFVRCPFSSVTTTSLTPFYVLEPIACSKTSMADRHALTLNPLLLAELRHIRSCIIARSVRTITRRQWR